MEELRQCCAPISENKRCFRMVVANSDHCPVHRPNARKLYLRYKNICGKVDRFKFSNKISTILKYYVLLTKAYEARRKHRLIAYVPECYDYGHNKQFEIIMNKIQECEILLHNIYQSQSSTKVLDEVEKIEEVEEVEEVEEQEEDLQYKTNKVKRFKNRRIKDKEEDNRLLDKYIEANREVYQTKWNMMNILDQLMTKLTKCFVNADDTELIIIKIAIWNLLRELYRVGFFMDNFQIGKCNCCSESAALNISSLQCGCMKRFIVIESPFIFKLFMDQFTIDTIDKAKLSLTNKLGELCPLVYDLSVLYNIYGLGFLNLKFYLINKDGKFRLIINNNYTPKMSSITYDRLNRTSLHKLKEQLEIHTIAKDINDYYR